jgi:hypothetical protein
VAEDDLCVQITSKQQQKRQVSWRGATLEIPTLGGFKGCNVGWCPTVAKPITSGYDEITRVSWRYNATTRGRYLDTQIRNIVRSKSFSPQNQKIYPQAF